MRKVDKGFLYNQEINTVYFDPQKITVIELEEALKQAGTYRQTLSAE